MLLLQSKTATFLIVTLPSTSRTQILQHTQLLGCFGVVNICAEYYSLLFKGQSMNLLAVDWQRLSLWGQRFHARTSTAVRLATWYIKIMRDTFLLISINRYLCMNEKEGNKKLHFYQMIISGFSDYVHCLFKKDCCNQSPLRLLLLLGQQMETRMLLMQKSFIQHSFADICSERSLDQ